MGKYPVKTEEDIEKKEFANMVASKLIQNIQKIAKEKNLNEAKDFRKIMRILKKEEKLNEPK